MSEKSLNSLIKDDDTGVAMSAFLVLVDAGSSQDSDTLFLGENFSGNLDMEGFDGGFILRESVAGIHCANCGMVRFDKLIYFTRKITANFW